MAYVLTQKSKDVLASDPIEPQLLVKIEGFDFLLTSANIEQLANYGDPGLLYGQPGLLYGQPQPLFNQKELISLSGTTNNITQQILPDEGAANSTTNLTLALVNKDNELAELLTSGPTTDILARRVEVWLGAKEMLFPTDFIRIFVGNITQVETPPGAIRLTISHPENQKRALLFPKVTGELTAAIDNVQTSINLEPTANIINPSGLIKTYLKIEDEIIEVGTVNPTSVSGCTRGALGTTAASHADETEFETLYRLGDATFSSNAIDLALQLLISKSFPGKTLTPESLIGSDIFVPGERLGTDSNFLVNDMVTLTNCTNPSNDGDWQILAISEDETGTTITTDATFITENPTPATLEHRSQYDSLPEGVALKPDQVDIQEFLKLKTLFSTSLPNYSIWIEDDTSGKELLNEQILFPAAMYSIPRKGQVSIGKTKPPLAEFDVPEINESTVLNASDLKVTRSTNENFYNAVVTKFGYNPANQKFLKGRIDISASSTNRIQSETKAFRIESKGLADTPDNLVVLANNAGRILDRYQFAAESIKGVEVPFSEGWNVEVGDTLVVSGLQLLDSNSLERNLEPRLMEVTNRAFNFKRGTISLDLTNTAFNVDGRYGVISPSSQLGSGSTTSTLTLKKSFWTQDTLERTKWTTEIGRPIKVRSPDWTFEEETTLTGFDPANSNNLLIDPPLTSPPLEDYIVDVAHYDEADSTQKAVYCFLNPHVTITANSPDQFTATVASTAAFFVGAIVRIHDPTFDVRDSQETTVTNITPTQLTFADALGFNPQTGDEIDLIGFVSDEGLPYRYL